MLGYTHVAGRSLSILCSIPSNSLFFCEIMSRVVALQNISSWLLRSPLPEPSAFPEGTQNVPHAALSGPTLSLPPWLWHRPKNATLPSHHGDVPQPPPHAGCPLSQGLWGRTAGGTQRQSNSIHCPRAPKGVNRGEHLGARWVAVDNPTSHHRHRLDFTPCDSRTCSPKGVCATVLGDADSG